MLPKPLHTLTLISLAFIGLLYTPLDQAAKLKSRKTEQKSEGVFAVKGASGLAVFKDIQVPVNAMSLSRGDGTVAKEEFQNHLGFPMILGLEYSRKTSNEWQPVFAIELMSISSAVGPLATQTSSFSRFNLGTGIDFQFEWLGLAAHWGLRLDGRRSAFENLSNGHHINAAVLGVNAGLLNEGSFKVTSYVGAAPVTEFRYHDGKNFAGRRFESSKASLSEWGILTSFNLHHNAWLELGLEQERYLIQIDDLSEYDSFGLAVTPTDMPTRIYDFATSVVRFGFRKNF